MRRAQWHQIGTAFGLYLLAAVLLRLAGRPPTGTVGPRWRYPRSHAPRARPFDAALREAIEWQQRAVNEAARRQELLHAWDPQAEPDGDPRQWQEWEQEVACDRSGYLHEALSQAERAATLARTRHEICRVGALQAALECSLGDHEAELRQARRIVKLQPHDPLCLYALRHAARCKGLKRLEQQMDAALEALGLEPRHGQCNSSGPPPAGRSPRTVSPPPRDESARARREAIRWYGRATQIATSRVEVLEDWDPPAIGRTTPEARRRAAIAATRELRMAIRSGERAAHLATTRDDRYEASLLLSRLYCDAGLHGPELAQARILVALSPQSLTSLKAMRRAAGCNHLSSLARRTDAALEALQGSTTRVSLPFGPMIPPISSSPTPSASVPMENQGPSRRTAALPISGRRPSRPSYAEGGSLMPATRRRNTAGAELTPGGLGHSSRP